MKYIFPILLFPVAAIGQTAPKSETIFFDTIQLKQHVITLASDAFEGRKPFTVGETKTINYLISQLKKTGLAPGNNGSYLQQANFTLTHSIADSLLAVHFACKTISLKKGVDYAIYSSSPNKSESLTKCEIVFVGYGIVAPEYHRNDYEGLQVKDKVVVVLMHPTKTDQHLFTKTKSITYYENLPYKLEEAARQGAKAVFLVPPSSESQMYSIPAIQKFFDQGFTNLQGAHECAITGFLSWRSFMNILSLGGLDSTTIVGKLEGNFKGKALPVRLSTAAIKIEHQRKHSFNVVAQIKGTKMPNESIVYSAHWDHLGIGRPDKNGDSIYNGASDNALGVAVVLEIARSFQQHNAAPGRTLVFLFTTAEEMGMLGSRWYTTHLPQKRVLVADINIDGFSRYGRTKDMVMVGKGMSDLDGYVESELKRMGRYLREDPEPEQGYFFRSDQLSFIKKGVPSLFMFRGIDYINGGTGYDTLINKKYQTYHTPADEYNNDWHFDGTAEDMLVLYNIGRRMANTDITPKLRLSNANYR
jgi:Zn-dependent M28 family amino/carboxypeptidase